MKLIMTTIAAACLMLVGCANFEPGEKEVSVRHEMGAGNKISAKIYNKFKR